MTDTPEIPSFLDPAVQDDPFDAYALMREHCPVHRLPENGLHMVTRYDDARAVLSDPAEAAPGHLIPARRRATTSRSTGGIEPTPSSAPIPRCTRTTADC
jgi:cytochrome P450